MENKQTNKQTKPNLSVSRLYIAFFGIDLPAELQLSSRSWQLLSNYISLKNPLKNNHQTSISSSS
jgi:hypothetical protein